MQLAEQFIVSIKGKLTYLVCYVQISNSAGLFDTNTIAEDFYCKLLSKIYSYINLENLNKGESNISAIDLGDRNSRTCYQITSEDSTTKVHESIIKFVKKAHYVNYDRLIILIITTKSSHPNVNYDSDTGGHFVFNKDQDVKDVGDLLSDIRSLNSSTLKEIDDFLDKELKLFNSFKELTLCPNVPIEKIIGREEDIRRIQEKLNESSTPILLKGIGGIGKSSLAKVILQLNRYKYNNLVWVNAASGIREAFINNKVLLSNLNIEFSESAQVEDRFDIVVNKLRSLPSGLLVIDNALIDLATEIKHIPYNSNWKVLVTSRIEFDQLDPYELKSLSDEDAIKLFYKNYSIERNDTVALRILKYINNHTLTIELLSKTADKRKMLLSDLDEQLIENGLNIEPKVKVATDHSSQDTEYAFVYLTKIFDISEIGEMEEILLRHFSVISTDSLTYKELEELFPTDNSSQKDNFWEAIEELVAKGWLSKDLENNYSIHPVIQEVARFKLTPTVERCVWVIYSLRQIKFINHAKAYVDYFLKNDTDFREEKSPLINLSTGIADIFYSNNDYKNANKYQLKAILFFEKIMGSDHYELTFLLYDYFKYLSKSPDFSEKALLVQQRAFDITKHHKENLGYDLSIDEYFIFYQNRAEVCISLGLLSEANQLLGEIDNLVKKISEKEFESKKVMLLNTLGRLSLLKEDNESALKYQLEAVEILEEQVPILEEFPLVLNNLAGSYFRLGMIDDALKVTHKNIQFIENKSLKVEYLAKAYNTMALILSKSNLEKAMDYQIQAIDILTELLGESHYDVANNISNKGRLYSKLEKHVESLYCQKRALEIRLESLPAQSIIVAESYYWIALCHLDLNELDEALKYMQESLLILSIYPQQEILSKLIPAYEKLSFILYQKNEIDGAISALNEAIKLSSSDVKYLEKSLELTNVLSILLK